MKQLLLLLCVISLCGVRLGAQTKPKPPATAPAAAPQQKKPPPYVMKTDYDVKIASMEARINSALGAASSVKNEVAGKFDKVAELDSKMSEVEQVLNNANIKLGETSDSLTKARAAAVEFRKTTEAKMVEFEKANKSAQTMLYGVIGLVIVLCAGIIFMMIKRMQSLKNQLRNQTETMNAKISDRLDAQNKELKDDIAYMKSNIQTDLRFTQQDLNTKIESAQAHTSEQLQMIMDKLNA